MTVQFIAERLRQLRQRHGVTQEQFAEVAGVSYKFYQQIESGRKKQMWLETVERLAAGFGLAAWQLLAPELPPETSLVSSRNITRSKQRQRPIKASAAKKANRQKLAALGPK